MSMAASMRSAPWTFAAPWGARGHVSDLDGPVHWIEFTPGDSPDGTPIIFVHGLGGSHLNWCLIGPKLAVGRRAVALDLHGFGLTPGSRATATVQRNAGLLDRFVREVTGTPVILVGNSMGGLISILHTASAPDTVEGLVLIDPALPVLSRIPDRQVGSQFLLYALPGLGELYVRAVMSRRSPELCGSRSCSSAARPTGWCRRRACARRLPATRAGRRSCCPESGTPPSSRPRIMSSPPYETG